MNTRAKGRRAENEFKAYLEAKGYQVEQVKGSQMFNKSVDFFGCFDLIAFNKHNWLLVQVKSNVISQVKEITNWVEINKPPNTEVCIVARMDGKKLGEKWKFRFIPNDQPTTVEDLSL